MNQSDDSSDVPTKAELEREGERLNSLIPLNARLSIADAFELQKQIAEGLGVAPYKDENRFRAALRKLNLTTTVQISTDPGWWKQEERILVEKEVTAKNAVEELFEQRATQRRKLDRQRKANKKSAVSPKKNFQKSSRNVAVARAENLHQKRKLRTKKRNRGVEKRNARKLR